MKFFTGAGRNLEFEDMIKEIEDFIIQEKEKDGQVVKLIIGTDSQISQGGFVFAVAVALHSVGHGGRFYIHREKKNKFYHLSERLFEEASLSLDVAQKMKGNRIIDTVDKIEIHADVGYNGKSSKYANAIKAMIEGYGFIGMIKPDAAVATHIADHYVR